MYSFSLQVINREGGSRLLLMLCILLQSVFFVPLVSAESAAVTVDEEIVQRVRQKLILSKQQKDWLAEHPVIRVGVDAGYAPYSFLDASGNFTGVVPDYLNILSMSLGVAFKPVPDISWQEIIADAKTRDLDLIATAVITPEREKYLDFSQMYLPTPLVIMTQRDNRAITSADHLEGKKVALVEAYSSSKRVLKEHPAIVRYPVSNPLEGLRALAAGEVDAYVGVLGVNYHLSQKYGLSNLKIAGRYDLESNGQRFAARSDWPELRAILDKVINVMTPQDHAYLINKWIPVDTSGLSLNFTEASPLELSGEEKQWLSTHPTITIGTMDNWPPMDYLDDEGHPAGIGARFIELLNERLGGVLKIVPGDWNSIYEGAKEKKLDALIGITPSDERQHFFNFTKPYVTVPHVIFARKGEQYIQDLNGLMGKKVALERDFYLKGIINQRYPLINVEEYDTTSDALDAVVKGQADAYIGNRAVAMYIIHNELIPNLVEQGKIKVTSSVNAIGVRKDWPILRTILQKALDNITVTERLALLQRWVDTSPYGGPESVELTVDEWAWLENHPVIRVAGDANWAPIEYKEQNGLFNGISAEYLNVLAQTLGVRFEYDQYSSWHRATEKVKNRSLDMFAAAAATPSRLKYASFTEPYMTLPAVVFTRDNVSYISGLDNLERRKVAVVGGYAIEELIRRGGWNLELVEVESISQGLDLLQEGDVFAYIGSILATSHILREKGYTNIRVSGQTPYSIDVSMGARNDWPMLTRILNKAIAHISDTQKTNISARWIGVQIIEEPDYRKFWQVLLIGVVALILFFVWNWYLRRVNTVQSAAIKNQNRSLIVSQNLLAEAQRIARLGSWEWNVATGICYWSSELYRILGRPESPGQTITFKQFIEAVYPEDRERVEGLLYNSIEKQENFLFEHRIASPDGTLRYVQEQGEVVVSEHGGTPTVTGTVLDISARKEAEHEIRKLQFAFDNTPVAIIITDTAGNIEYVNPYFSEMTGYSSEDVSGCNPRILKTCRTSEAEYRELWETITAGNTWRGEFRNRRKNGEFYWESATIAPVKDETGTVVNFLGLKQDVSFQKDIEARLYREENFNSLTQLPNRSYLLNQIDLEIREKKPLAVLLVAMTNLKRINASLGIQAGDTVIMKAARRLNDLLEPDSLLGHLGGGQFLFLIEKPLKLREELLIARILTVFNKPFDVLGETVHQSVSIGVSHYPDDAETSQEILSRAHVAVTQAKQTGPNAHVYFSQEYSEEAQRQLHMESKLRGAVAANELEVFCQPQVDIAGKFVGAEALLRWFNPDLGSVPPDMFIPLAEQTDLILDIGRWVINESCRQGGEWQKAGVVPFVISINMSPKQFLDRGIVSFIESCIQRHNLRNSQVAIEVTEGLFLEDADIVKEQIDRLKKSGITLAMDDFGTGYSSLQYLRKYDFDTLKVDRSFVSELPDSSGNASLVSAILAMSRSLGVKTVAEGVETQEQASFLRREGCDLFQGYLFGKPMNENDFRDWLEKAGAIDHRFNCEEEGGETAPDEYPVD